MYTEVMTICLLISMPEGSNTAVCMERSSQTHSIPKTTWKSFFNQKVRHLSVGRRYRFGHRMLLGLFMSTWLITWFAGLLLAFLSENYFLVAGLLGLRIILFTLTVWHASKKLEEKFELWIVPLLDFIYAFYYLVTGLRTLVTKKVRWKN